MPLIAEVKVRSPKQGELLRGRHPGTLAATYEGCDAAGVAVVTEPASFGGTLELVRLVRRATDLPIVRNDFLSSPEHLDATRDAGADVIVLVVKALPADRLAQLHAYAQAIGLETFLQVHSIADIARIAQLGLIPDVIGVNNRDITIGEIDDGDVSHTEALARAIPAGPPVISESGIRGTDDVIRARVAGADAVLVGTAILQAADPGAMVAELVGVGWPA
jgi:indole-3-glycerol phosphate synthase